MIQAEPVTVSEDHVVGEAAAGTKPMCFFYCCDREGALRYVSPEVTALLGWRQGEFLDRHTSFWTDHPGNRQATRRAAASRRGRPQPPYQVEFRHRGGGQRMFELTEVPHESAAGGVDSVLGIARDVADRPRLEPGFRPHAQAVDQCPACVLITDAHGRIVYVNPAFTESTGYTAEEAMGKSPRMLKSGIQSRDYYRQMWDTLTAGGTWRSQVRNRHRDGHLIWHSMVTAPVIDEQGGITHYVSVQEDITEQKRLEHELHAAAHTDVLTGLANRSLVTRTLDRMLAAQPPPGFSVLVLDLDRFKIVNDSLGHAAGDELLTQVAARLRRAAAPAGADEEASGPTLARLGGDAFAVVLTEVTDEGAARQAAADLFEAIGQPFDLEGRRVHTTASVGIVTPERAADSGEAILRDAGTAADEAKTAGKGRAVVFEPSMRRRAQRRMRHENDLRQALGTEQLYVVYQPIVALASGRVVSAEALLRWAHPQVGPISPAEFIPVAEESGLIGPLGEWVFEQACRDFKAWHREAPGQAPSTVSVNLSRVQLRDVAIPRRLEGIVRTAGLSAGAVVLEVTERDVMGQAEGAQAALEKLAAEGFSLALDDFGTGSSSLACLGEFPVDTLKVDRAFVGQLQADRGRTAVLEATRQLAANLGLTVVAEGIENAEQLAAVQALDIERGQGFYFAAPLKAAELLGAARAGGR